jgi:hypothetical protein
MWSRNFRVFVNFPKQVPSEIRFSRETLAAFKKIFDGQLAMSHLNTDGSWLYEGVAKTNDPR